MTTVQRITTAYAELGLITVYLYVLKWAWIAELLLLERSGTCQICWLGYFQRCDDDYFYYNICTVSLAMLHVCQI